MRTFALLVILALVAAAIVINSTGDDSKRTRVVVLAAASLSEISEEIERLYEAEHDGLDLVFSFAGSSLLARQIEEGAPVDLFLSAAPEPVKALDPLAQEPVASNVVVVAVRATSEIKAIRQLNSYALAACAPQVPCGAAAQAFLASQSLTPVTLENDVAAVVSKVRLGEVDAGLVYRTDVISHPELRAIETGMALSTTYVGAAFSPTGLDLLAFIRSEPVQALLGRAGFGSP